MPQEQSSTVNIRARSEHHYDDKTLIPEFIYSIHIISVPTFCAENGLQQMI